MSHSQASPFSGLQAGPGHALTHGEADDVRLIEPAPAALINLRGDADDPAFLAAVQDCGGPALPLQPNTVAHSAAWLALWLSPDEWLLRGADPQTGARDTLNALERALQGRHFALTDQSSGHAILHLQGPRASETLNRGCPLDLHPKVFPSGHCAQSLYFQISVLLHPLETRGSVHVHWEIIVRRSFADAAARQIMDAMRDR
ncbi:MAG: sarcosine oxidase subunit gamma family protein [Castellaniella sp.]